MNHNTSSIKMLLDAWSAYGSEALSLVNVHEVAISVVDERQSLFKRVPSVPSVHLSHEDIMFVRDSQFAFSLWTLRENALKCADNELVPLGLSLVLFARFRLEESGAVLHKQRVIVSLGDYHVESSYCYRVGVGNVLKESAPFLPASELGEFLDRIRAGNVLRRMLFTETSKKSP